MDRVRGFRGLAHREFVRDYVRRGYTQLVDPGRFDAAKGLVYDGQQRLQTLYSVLLHTFLNRTLHFDLLFDAKSAETDETGFIFRDAGATPDPRYISMTWLFSRSANDGELTQLQEDRAGALGASNSLLVRTNLNSLWKTFVETDRKSIAYFSVRSPSAKEVNEVFRRLNTGGVPLTEAELLLSAIKAIDAEYEQKLWRISKQISDSTGGYQFLSADVLQFLHLLVMDTIRIDPDRVTPQALRQLSEAAEEYAPALEEFFTGYLRHLFGINHNSIVPRPLALLPIAAYLAGRKKGGHDYRIVPMQKSSLQAMDDYFLLSQCCDWNTQTIVNQIARQAISHGLEGKEFPLAGAREIAAQKNRTITLQQAQFLAHPRFALKLLLPHRVFVFHERKPQIDHIFPLAMGDDEYKAAVDVLWNFQPIPAEVNNFKRATPPREFFNTEEGKKYLNQYDFLPALSSTEWDDPLVFVANRRLRMLTELQHRFSVGLDWKAEHAG